MSVVQQVTRRELASEGEWADWNWRTDGDIMMNGAFFVPSGEGATMQYAKASSVSPKSANQIDQLTMNAGVLGGPRYTHTHKNIPSMNVCVYYKSRYWLSAQLGCLHVILSRVLFAAFISYFISLVHVYAGCINTIKYKR